MKFEDKKEQKTMSTVQKSVRIPSVILNEIERIALKSGRAFSFVINDLLEEAIKIRRCPGITFADGVNGRRARIAGTGIEVWEIIMSYESLNSDLARLKKAYHWLTEQQIMAAIGYYRTYPDEIKAQIEKNALFTKERIAQSYPYLGSIT
ncbi:MAG: DUF433 domain-containing protein [Pseudomonadota bacterium]